MKRKEDDYHSLNEEKRGQPRTLSRSSQNIYNSEKAFPTERTSKCNNASTSNTMKFDNPKSLMYYEESDKYKKRNDNIEAATLSVTTQVDENLDTINNRREEAQDYHNNNHNNYYTLLNQNKVEVGSKSLINMDLNDAIKTMPFKGIVKPCPVKLRPDESDANRLPPVSTNIPANLHLLSQGQIFAGSSASLPLARHEGLRSEQIGANSTNGNDCMRSKTNWSESYDSNELATYYPGNGVERETTDRNVLPLAAFNNLPPILNPDIGSNSANGASYFISAAESLSPVNKRLKRGSDRFRGPSSNNSTSDAQSPPPSNNSNNNLASSEPRSSSGKSRSSLLEELKKKDLEMKLRNREAARRSRLRKQDQVKQLQEQLENLQSQHELLLKEREILKEELRKCIRENYGNSNSTKKGDQSN